MYRVTIEHILGLRREGNVLTFNPCVPARWSGYRVTYRIPGAEYVIQVENAEGSGGGVRSVALDGNVVDGAGIFSNPTPGGTRCVSSSEASRRQQRASSRSKARSTQA